VLVNDIWGAELLKGGPADWNTGNWRDALHPDRPDDRPTAPEGFARSESPRFVGRAVAGGRRGPGPGTLEPMIGLFWGAPVIAREVEQGTHRMIWTQGSAAGIGPWPSVRFSEGR
jgi:hypothetical protein